MYDLSPFERPLIVAVPLSGFENAHHAAISTYRLRENDAIDLTGLSLMII